MTARLGTHAWCHLSLPQNLQQYMLVNNTNCNALRLGTHVSATITSDTKMLHVYKQQTITSSNKLFLVVNCSVDDNKTWYTCVSLSTSGLETYNRHVCKQQIASGNKLLLVIH